MTSLSPMFRALILATIAIAAWIGVVLFAFTIQSDEQTAAFSIDNAQTQGAAQQRAQEAHALVEATTEQRAQLQDLFQSDALSIASQIVAAGQDAGVVLHVSSAASESTDSIGFTVEASSTFPKLLNAAGLLETMPIPSSIQSIDLSRPGSESPSSVFWQMDVQVNVLTASSTAS